MGYYFFAINLKDMKYKFEEYLLKLNDAVDDDTCRLALSPSTGLALLKERRKLYVVHIENEIIYVGEAHTSLKKRFQRGCTSYNFFRRNNNVARGGYKGYKWLNKQENLSRNLNVSVAIFDSEYDEKRNIIEAVEGELVYLIRNKHGYWPKFQNEIHFSNCEEAKEIAEGILEKIFIR